MKRKIEYSIGKSRTIIAYTKRKKSFVTKENLRGAKKRKKNSWKTNERKRKKIFRSRSVKSRNLCVQYLAERGKEERVREREKDRKRAIAVEKVPAVFLKKIY